MDVNDKVRMIAEGEFEVQAKLTVDDITDICRRLRGAESERDYSKLELSSLRREYLSSFNISKEKINSLESELEAIKKQEPVRTEWRYCTSKYGQPEYWSEWAESHPGKTGAFQKRDLYANPVYQHSFTVDGHTFYADNEADILCLERKFGVGGKAKLNLVEDK